MLSSAARLAGPSSSPRRASCLVATSFLARASTARPLSVSTRMWARRSLVERIRASGDMDMVLEPKNVMTEADLKTFLKEADDEHFVREFVAK